MNSSHQLVHNTNRLDREVHCYADGTARRWGHELWRRNGERRMLSEQNWQHPLRWNRDAERAGVPAKVFGGESGPRARPMEISWASGIVAQCRAASVPVFVKQFGAVAGRELGAGPKGGDWDTWPEDLKVRQFPRTDEAGR